MKIGQKLIISLILLTIHIQAFSSDCKEITKREDYKICEFVFIGEIVKVDAKYITILPYEMLKGDEKEIFWAVNYDAWQVNTKGYEFFLESQVGEIWLFYGENVSNDTLLISRCGWSRNFFHPYTTPPPPNMDQFQSINYLVKEMAELSDKIELYQDIQVYRYNKKEPEQSAENSKPDYSVLFTSIITALLLILIVLNINILRRMK